MSQPMTTGEKVETAAWTLVVFALFVCVLFGVVGVFYFMVWGLR